MKRFAVLVVAGVALTGCNSYPGNNKIADAAVAGGVTGAIIGGVATGSWAGAAVGAGIGSVTGALIGSAM